MVGTGFRFWDQGMYYVIRVLTSIEVQMCVCVCVYLWSDLATKATWKIHLQQRTKGVWYKRRVVGWWE